MKLTFASKTVSIAATLGALSALDIVSLAAASETGKGESNGYSMARNLLTHSPDLHQEEVENIKAAVHQLQEQQQLGKGSHEERILQIGSNITLPFVDFCSSLVNIYDSAGYTCACDVDEFNKFDDSTLEQVRVVECKRPLGDVFSTLQFVYHVEKQLYWRAWECLCSTEDCNEIPNECYRMPIIFDTDTCSWYYVLNITTNCFACNSGWNFDTGFLQVNNDGCWDESWGFLDTYVVNQIPTANSDGENGGDDVQLPSRLRPLELTTYSPMAPRPTESPASAPAPTILPTILPTSSAATTYENEWGGRTAFLLFTVATIVVTSLVG